jgi:hypothetical protein
MQRVPATADGQIIGAAAQVQLVAYDVDFCPILRLVVDLASLNPCPDTAVTLSSYVENGARVRNLVTHPLASCGHRLGYVQRDK